MDKPRIGENSNKMSRSQQGKCEDDRDARVIRDSEQMKSRVKQAIYDKFRNEFDKATDITLQHVCVCV